MEKEDDFGISNIDNSMILPSFIDRNYLEKKFNEEKSNKQEEIAKVKLQTKIIVDDQKLTIFEVDETKNIEYKIYESDDFRQVIRKLSETYDESDFEFYLHTLLKNGIFIIQLDDLSEYGYFFFMKFNKSKNKIEILAEEHCSRMDFILEFPNGNFAYNSYLDRHFMDYNNFYIFDIKKNEKFLTKYRGYSFNNDFSNFAFLSNGFAFSESFIHPYYFYKRHNYFRIFEGFNYDSYNIDFIGQIKKIIYDDKYFYLLKKNVKNSDNKVFIFNLENKKFYSNYFNITYEEKNEIGENEINNKQIDIKISIFNKIINNKEPNAVNIIYHDENLKFNGKEIILDSQFIEKEMKGTLILSNDLENLDLLLKKLKKDETTSEFILIVNGGSAKKTFDFIRKKGYSHLFINGIIYTTNMQKYESLIWEYKEFFKKICINKKDIVEYLKKTVEKIKYFNENYYINFIINNIAYKEIYYSLNKELSKYYGDETQKSFDLNYNIFNDFLNK